MLQKEKSGFPSANSKVLFNLSAFFTTKGRIRQNHIMTIFFPYSLNILGEGIGLNNIRHFNAMQDHVHDADNVSQTLFLFAIKSGGLELF